MKAVLLVLRFFIRPKDVKIILAVLACLIVLPALGVMAVAQAPIEAVSNALANLNPVTHNVDIKDANGAVIAQLQVSTVWPLKGKVTTEFGDTTPYQKSHTGIDIASKKGDPITPFMSGTVTVADTSGKTGYGKYVSVYHGNNVSSLYAHMDAVNVRVGQTVAPGDIIGYEGATGHVVGNPGNHVHFEIRAYDIPVNPRVFMVGNPS